MTPRASHSTQRLAAPVLGLVLAPWLGLVHVALPPTAAAQSRPEQEMEQPGARSETEAPGEAPLRQPKRRTRRLRPAPQLEGLGAILFNPPTAESLLGASPPSEAQATTAPGPSPDSPPPAAAPPAEPEEPGAAEGTAAEAAPAAEAPPEGGEQPGQAEASEEGAPSAESAESAEPAASAEAAETAATAPAATAASPPELTGGDEAYPFLGQDVEQLIDSTNAILDELPDLVVPPIDPDLLQFGTSYSFSGGTGTLPGTRAEVAHCGFDFDLEAMHEGMESGLPRSPLEILQRHSDAVCCSFDPQTQRYRCGDPSSFPNRQSSFRGAYGEDMVMVCLEVPEEQVQYLQGITYVDGSSVRAGSNCCAVSQGYLASSGGGGVPSMAELLRASEQCAPASVSMASGFGSRNGDVAATTEIYAEGTLQMFAERRNDAYRVDVDGRLSLMSSVVLDDDDTNDQYTLRGQLGRLYADYRRYLSASSSSLFILGGVDMNDAIFDLTKAGGADLAKTYNAPTRFSIGAGLGRIYDIEPRIRLRKLEQMLLQHGVIKETLPHEVARDIMVAWWALRTELGYDQRLLYTFKVLKDAGLLAGPITTAVVYRFGQIINDSQLAHRRQGSDTHALLRLNKRLQNDVDSQVLVVLEVHDEHVYNVTYDTEVFWDIAFSLAPREEDWSDNLLAGEPVPFAGLVGGMLALNVPVGFRAYNYDAFMNKLGLWELQARFAAGYADPDRAGALAPQGLAFSVGAGAKYTLFQSTTRGVSFVVNADCGRLNGKLVYALVGGISMALGNRESYYVAPGDLGDALPFDLPLPHLVSGQ